MSGLADTLSPTASAHDDPLQAVHRITVDAGSSFSPAMRILPVERRHAMWALYAYSRIVDDIADEPGALEEKRILLDEWQQEVEHIFEGQAVSAVGRALEAPVRRYGLPKCEFLRLIDGMRMDVCGPIVGPSITELQRYTRSVAGSVGLLSMRIFGAWRGAASTRFALALGDALQMTNILRDIEEDAELGRLYLPREWLDEAGMPHDPSGAAAHPALPKVCARLGEQARQQFQAARALVPQHSRLRLAPALLMMGVYEAYLQRMKARHWHRNEPVWLSKPHKLLAGLRCVMMPRAGPVA